MQKGLAPILIVLLVAILGIGGYFWFNYSNNRTKPAQYVQNTTAPTTKPESSSSAETANWKVYTGKYFSLKYPSNWETVPLSSEPAYYNPSLESYKLKVSSNASLLISAYDKKEDPYSEELNLPNAKPLKVNGRDAVRLDNTDLPDPLTRVSVKGDQNVGGYHILFNWGSSDTFSEELVNQILSTFKFTP